MPDDKLTWRPYLNDRLVAEHPDGFFVIVPDDVEPAVPLSCPVCDRLLRTRDDETAYKEFKCCDMCAMQWAHARRKEWSEGWRPTSDQVKEAVSNRPPLTVVFDVG